MYESPWNTPETCDHQEWGENTGPGTFCTHCCPCAECGADRAESTALARYVG